MTQEQLAMLLGVSRQSVTKWEAEKSYPEMDKLLKLCQIFDCSLDDLVQGDLTQQSASGEEPSASTPTIPSGPPQDICGYDEHQRMMAWKIPTGIAIILVGIALGFFFEGSLDLANWNGKDGLFIMLVLAGIFIGLVFLIPAGMAHSSFVKAHPFVEDFYTEEDKARARTTFTRGLIGGIASIFVGIGCFLFLDEQAENYALFFLLLFAAIGVWNIVHYGMLLGRTNIAEYNNNVAEELEMEDILNAQINSEVKEKLIDQKKHGKQLGAICGSIMILSTIVGLGLLFGPVLMAPDPSNFEPEGTPTMWFWLAWPAGGLLCGIVALLWEAFKKSE